MLDSHQLYKKRLSSHVKELNRYLQYIFNGHLAVAMLFLMVALAYYYQQWLDQLPDQFPTAFVIGIIFGLLVSYSPIRTLLKEPDLVFLRAAEHRMHVYFRNTIIYSFVIQLYQIALAAAALGPLYFHTYGERPSRMYMYILLALIIVKGWNIVANWWVLKVRNVRMRRRELITRVFLNCAIFYFFVSGQTVIAGVITIVFIVLFLNSYRLSRNQEGVAWDLLVENDQKRMQSFYRIANMFIDVPHMKSPIRKRIWLTRFISRVPFMKKYTYDYLYRLSFSRGGGYLGMYMRLLVIGGLIIYFVPNSWMKLIFALLFLYLTSFQMIPLYHHHRTIIWLDIYPVTKKMREKSLLTLLLQLAVIQTVLFAFIFLFTQDYLGSILTLVAGTLFSVLFVHGYVKRKIAAL